MNDVRHRYHNDAVFHNVVNVLRNAIVDAMLTPSETQWLRWEKLDTLPSPPGAEPIKETK